MVCGCTTWNKRNWYFDLQSVVKIQQALSLFYAISTVCITKVAYLVRGEHCVPPSPPLASGGHCLPLLFKQGNLVNWFSMKSLKLANRCHFKAKMHQIWLRLELYGMLAYTLRPQIRNSAYIMRTRYKWQIVDSYEENLRAFWLRRIPKFAKGQWSRVEDDAVKYFVPIPTNTVPNYICHYRVILLISYTCNT